MTKITIFASGSGSNAENIISWFLNNKSISVVAVFTNNPKAGVISRAKRLNVPTYIFDKSEFQNEKEFLTRLGKVETNFIVLAGFLWLIPHFIIKNFRNRIVNIHPALLPEFGGKGMYGENVHNAVINAKSKESGITIHIVNEVYDNGQIVFQAKCSVDENETIETLQEKIHKLEYKHFPRVIEEIVKDNLNGD